MTTKRSTALITAGLAIFAAPAFAAGPERGSAKGKSQSSHQAKGVGFTIAGADLTGLAVAQDGTLSGPLSLDPTSANRHARSFLGLTRAEIAGQDVVPVGAAGDKVLVKYVGLTSTDAIRPTDRVKVIGKVTRVGKGSTATRTVDIRRITVKRATPTTQAAAQQG